MLLGSALKLFKVRRKKKVEYKFNYSYLVIMYENHLRASRATLTKQKAHNSPPGVITLLIQVLIKTFTCNITYSYVPLIILYANLLRERAFTGCFIP